MSFSPGTDSVIASPCETVGDLEQDQVLSATLDEDRPKTTITETKKLPATSLAVK